jgi:glycine/D-amino acid oxidase-like deaminating enzyme/nitrite reductase/ring-hydroxylating ferredoxin subunit
LLSDTGYTDSLWMRTAPLRLPPPLDGDIRADVCVIGAGIAGITTAYLLARAGKQVVVLEHGAIGGGDTGRTTAHLSNALDDRYYVLERLHGVEGARLAAASHTVAIDLIEATIRDERIDCDFERLDGYLFVPLGESPEILDIELDAALRAGVVGVERLARVPGSSFDTGPCLRFPRQGQFHPLTYVNALAAALERTDGQAIRRAHVVGVEAGPPARIVTEAGPTVTADAVVCATNSPIVDWLAMHSKQAAYRTFAIGARVPVGSVPRALYWDTADPYHYVRLQGEVLIVGGEDHKTGQEDDGAERLRCLEAWARERFPIAAVEFCWSGQVMEPVDGLAYIGRNPGDHHHVFVVTGDSGQGMTHGTIAGMLIRDLIVGHRNAWEGLYDPSRKPLKAAREYVRENAKAVTQYAEHLTPGEVHAEADIRLGRGAVVRHGLKKVAVYRDDAGTLHRVSAVCTHLGCVVHWNSLERTWDCPCHGSRFGIDGKALNGPALRGLGTSDATEA